MDGRVLDFWKKEAERAHSLRQLSAIEAACTPDMEAEARKAVMAKYERIIKKTRTKAEIDEEIRESAAERKRIASKLPRRHIGINAVVDRKRKKR